MFLSLLPEGNSGIASKYPGDRGIGHDSAVVFADDFSSGAPKADTLFGDVKITRDADRVRTAGACALELVLPRDWPGRHVIAGFHHHIPEPLDCLFLRYYAKYDGDVELYHGGTHNGGTIAARAPGVPDAKPGIPADGVNEFTALLDTWRPDDSVRSPGPLAVYCYHPEQRHRWGEHFFASGRMLPPGTSGAEYFGSGFVPRPDIIPERGRWYCYELMVKANTPGQRDGRIAFWVDGKLAGDFPNMRLRDVDALKITRFTLEIYTGNPKVLGPAIMWYSDVVVAKSYVGPTC